MTPLAPDCPLCGDRHSHFDVRVRSPRFTLGPHTYETTYAPGVYPSREAAETAACAARQKEEA